MDNKGLLKNSKDKFEREFNINVRIKSLKDQIREHTNSVRACKELLISRGIL